MAYWIIFFVLKFFLKDIMFIMLMKPDGNMKDYKIPPGGKMMSDFS